MHDPDSIQRRNAALAKLAARKFRFEAKGLDHAMRKVGRRVPKRARVAAEALVAAEAKARHPKIRVQVDEVALESEYTALKEALDAVDPSDLRRGLVLSTLGMVAFQVIAVLTLLIVVLRWRGFV